MAFEQDLVEIATFGRVHQLIDKGYVENREIREDVKLACDGFTVWKSTAWRNFQLPPSLRLSCES
jgi:hypothetical protein